MTTTRAFPRNPAKPTGEPLTSNALRAPLPVRTIDACRKIEPARMRASPAISASWKFAVANQLDLAPGANGFAGGKHRDRFEQIAFALRVWPDEDVQARRRREIQRRIVAKVG